MHAAKPHVRFGEAIKGLLKMLHGAKLYQVSNQASPTASVHDFMFCNCNICRICSRVAQRSTGSTTATVDVEPPRRPLRLHIHSAREPRQKLRRNTKGREREGRRDGGGGSGVRNCTSKQRRRQWNSSPEID